jgi:hypothetical protein
MANYGNSGAGYAWIFDSKPLATIPSGDFTFSTYSWCEPLVTAAE